MDAIAKEHPVVRPWTELMQMLRARLEAQGVHPARAVVLLPYAQLMPVARQFWGRLAPTGFAPRFETTMNWSRQWPWSPGDADLAFDMGRDLLAARGWLEQGGLGARAEALAPRLVEAAWQAGEAARAIAPGERAAWAARLRPQLLLGLEAPALATEAALARIAFEWAAASSYASDALLDGTLTREIELLVVLQGLQLDGLTRALVEQMGARAEAWPLPAPAPHGQLALHAASHAADEAEQAAACVLAHLQAGRVPVALGATDRVLTRRVGALLATRGVPVRDETGWKLSTTRAAAQLMAALRAMAWDASCDAVLDWLKSSSAWPSGVLQRLERQVRRAGQREWHRLRGTDWGEAATLQQAAQQVAAWRAGFQEARTLPQWLQALQDLLQQCRLWRSLAADAAGSRLLEALGLGGEEGGTPWRELPQGQRRLGLPEFTSWVNEVLEALSFVPPTSGEEQVTVLPMSQLLGHPFAALVLPGCDERNLPPAPEPPPPWSLAQRRLLGLPGREELEAVQRAAWRLALQLPRCDLLWRGSDDSGEPLLPSPLLQALLLDGNAAPAADPRLARRLRAEGLLPPAPAAAPLVPPLLSASSYEDLRRCPYRFFALRMLGLREADELDAEVDKRDFGSWLHGVLKTFHERLLQQPGADAAQRVALLDAAARDGLAAQRLDEGEFLPFSAGWPALRDGYLAWLAEHEAQGHAFAAGEAERQVALGPLTLQGRIDRIDQGPGGLLVMDYKTESAQATRDRMKQPLEDTQLAFYALLLPGQQLQAAYLNVGERGEVVCVPHPELPQASHLLREAIAADMRRLGEGAPLPALGEGRACAFCAARGLCRKDSWSQ